MQVLPYSTEENTFMYLSYTYTYRRLSEQWGKPAKESATAVTVNKCAKRYDSCVVTI